MPSPKRIGRRYDGGVCAILDRAETRASSGRPRADAIVGGRDLEFSKTELLQRTTKQLMAPAAQVRRGPGAPPCKRVVRLNGRNHAIRNRTVKNNAVCCSAIS